MDRVVLVFQSGDVIHWTFTSTGGGSFTSGPAVSNASAPVPLPVTYETGGTAGQQFTLVGPL